MFQKATLNYLTKIKQGTTLVGLLGSVTVFDSVKGGRTMRWKITGDDLNTIVTAGAAVARRTALRRIVKQRLKPRYLKWVAEPQPERGEESPASDFGGDLTDLTP